MLDLYCFSGGFTLNALAGGCSRWVNIIVKQLKNSVFITNYICCTSITNSMFRVVGVDSSVAAIEAARNNLDLNSPIINATKVQFYSEDAVKYMERAVKLG